MQLLQVLVLTAACGVAVAQTTTTTPAAVYTEPDPSTYDYLKPQSKRPWFKSAAEVWSKHRSKPHVDNWETLKKATDDTWTVVPMEYDPAYRNPCWKDAAGHFNCLPYFNILGVSKSGTTDLHARIVQFHPEIVEGRRKGPHFWDEAPYPQVQRKRDTYERTFSGYVNLFDRAGEQIQKNPLRVTGEASSNSFTGVLSFCRGRENPEKFNVTMAQYMFESVPWTRFIVMFRDPVDRYYSAYYYYDRWRRAGLSEGTPEDFHKQAVADIAEWERVVKEVGETAAIKAYRPVHLVKGMYALFIPPWLEYFPRDQFIFIRTEDYKASMKEHVLAVVDFLGLSPLSERTLAKMRTAENENAQRYADMFPETRKMLQEFYRTYNARLVKAMGNDPRWSWGY